MDPKLESVIQSRLRAAIIRKYAAVTQDMQKVVSEANSHGMFHSSRCQLELAKAAGDGAHAMATEIWTVIKDCLLQMGQLPGDNLAEDLKAIYQACLTDKDLTAGLYLQMAPKLQNLSMQGEIERMLSADSSAARGELDANIDLYVISMRNRPAQSEGNTFNFQNSQIGSLQTGGGNTAVVNMSLNAIERTELIQALQALAEVLKPVAAQGSEPAAEVLEHVDDGVTELQQENPKSSRWKASLFAIGNSLNVLVGLAANVKPAWETVRGLAAVRGILLPPFPG